MAFMILISSTWWRFIMTLMTSRGHHTWGLIILQGAVQWPHFPWSYLQIRPHFTWSEVTENWEAGLQSLWNGVIMGKNQTQGLFLRRPGNAKHSQTTWGALISTFLPHKVPPSWKWSEMSSKAYSNHKLSHWSLANDWRYHAIFDLIQVRETITHIGHLPTQEFSRKITPDVVPVLGQKILRFHLFR